MRKEELKSISNLLLSEGSLISEPRPQVLLKDISFFDNTSAQSRREELREEMQNQDNSVSNLDEEILSVFN